MYWSVFILINSGWLSIRSAVLSILCQLRRRRRHDAHHGNASEWVRLYSGSNQRDKVDQRVQFRVISEGRHVPYQENVHNWRRCWINWVPKLDQLALVSEHFFNEPRKDSLAWIRLQHVTFWIRFGKLPDKQFTGIQWHRFLPTKSKALNGLLSIILNLKTNNLLFGRIRSLCTLNSQLHLPTLNRFLSIKPHIYHA